MDWNEEPHTRKIILHPNLQTFPTGITQLATVLSVRTEYPTNLITAPRALQYSMSSLRTAPIPTHLTFSSLQALQVIYQSDHTIQHNIKFKSCYAFSLIIIIIIMTLATTYTPKERRFKIISLLRASCPSISKLGSAIHGDHPSKYVIYLPNIPDVRLHRTLPDKKHLRATSCSICSSWNRS